MNRALALQDVLRDARLWRGNSAAPLRAEPTGHAALDAVLPGGGWPLGALSEILFAVPGVGELRLAMPLLSRLTRQKKQVAVVAPPLRLHAPALRHCGIELQRLLVVEPRDSADALWSMEQLLHAKAGAVLLWQSRIDGTALRRLQLAAETGGGIGLLYRPLTAASESSVAGLRLRVAREDGEPQGNPQVEILKCRGARPPRRYALAR